MPKNKKQKKPIWMSEEMADNAKKRREKKRNQSQERQRSQKENSQRISERRDKKQHRNNICKNIEDGKRFGKTKEFFKKIHELRKKSFQL